MNQDDCAYIVNWSAQQDLPIANVLWTFNQFHLAKTIEELEQVVVDLKNDQYENEPYTKNETVMEIMRRTYLSQHRRIKNPDQEMRE